MKVYAKKNRVEKRAVAYQYLHNRTHVCFYRSVAYNEFYALQDINGKPLNNVTELVLISEKDPPLWKQDLNMRMGRRSIPTQSTRLIHVTEMNPYEIEQNPAIIYEFHQASTRRPF